MSPAQQEPEPEPASRHAYPRTRYRRQHKATKAESEASLSRLRQRFARAACITGGSYLTIIATNVVFPSILTLKETMGLEFSIGFLGVLLTLVAIGLWFLTQNTTYTLSLLDMIDAANDAGNAVESEAPATFPIPRQGSAAATPIPIERGHQVRQQRAHRAG